MPETMTQTKPEQETVQISASQGQLDVLDQLLKPEVQESLTTLVEQLPKLTELVNILTKSYDFAQTVATDEVLKKRHCWCNHRACRTCKRYSKKHGCYCNRSERSC